MDQIEEHIEALDKFLLANGFICKIKNDTNFCYAKGDYHLHRESHYKFRVQKISYEFVVLLSKSFNIDNFMDINNHKEFSKLFGVSFFLQENCKK